MQSNERLIVYLNYMGSLRKITVVPQGGLANRMRVIAAALSLVKDNHTKFEIRWVKNSELFCRFEQLFLLNPIYQNVYVNEGITLFDYLLRLKFPMMIFRKFLSFQDKKIYILGNEALDYRKKKLCVSGMDNITKEIYINSCHNISEEEQLLDIFLPTSYVNLKVKELTDEFAEKTYGLHIRRTDNIKSIIESPDELFIKKVRDIIESNKQSKFYLATDSIEVQELLINEFGIETFIIQNKVFERNIDKGIIDAYVDLLCLAKTKEIFGSYYSSFSEVASRIGNVKLTILKNE